MSLSPGPDPGERHLIIDVPASSTIAQPGEATAMPKPPLSMIAINPVLADRAGDFEDWLRTVLVPATRDHRPELLNRWEVLRAAKEEDGQVIFTFLFYGGEAADWQMEPILAQALGAEGARRALEDMLAMMKGLQYGWEVTPVDLAS
jgi:hypothetical protein